MYGMLLPSGNDAAVAMAVHLGTKLLAKKEEYDKLTALSVSESDDIEQKEEKKPWDSQVLFDKA